MTDVLFTPEESSTLNACRAHCLGRDSDLSREMMAAALNMRVSHYGRLVALGIDFAPHMATGSIGVANVRIEHDLYEPAEEGEAHLILPVTEGGFIVDLVAFQPKKPDTWALRRGSGWVLGHDAVEQALSPWPDQPASLLLTPTPLDWLRAGRGACVVQWTAEAAPSLRLARGIVVDDPRMAQVVRLQLSKPPALPPIGVMGAKADAA